MQLQHGFVRTLFAILSCLFLTVCTSNLLGSGPLAVCLGLGAGLLLNLLFWALERLLDLRALNVASVGLLCGLLFGGALLLLYNALGLPEIVPVRMGLLLFASYLGVMGALRGADSLHLVIPFVKLVEERQRVRPLLLDESALSDPRLIDFCLTGLLDGRLIVPRTVLRELHERGELGVLRRLQFTVCDEEPERESDPASRMVRLARLHDADILSAAISKVQMAAVEGVRVISLHDLSTALVPLRQAGETLQIRVQRAGKEPQQGIGYLEDGTMVVINGGGDSIGCDVQARVLSVKHSSSGRIVFTNLIETRELVEH